VMSFPLSLPFTQGRKVFKGGVPPNFFSATRPPRVFSFFVSTVVMQFLGCLGFSSFSSPFFMTGPPLKLDEFGETFFFLFGIDLGTFLFGKFPLTRRAPHLTSFEFSKDFFFFLHSTKQFGFLYAEGFSPRSSCGFFFFAEAIPFPHPTTIVQFLPSQRFFPHRWVSPGLSPPQRMGATPSPPFFSTNLLRFCFPAPR